MSYVGSILQVEDDEDILEITRIAIGLFPDVVLFQANTSAEARRLVNERDLDLILLDVMMPDADGPATLDWIRKAGFSHIPVIFLTARARSKDVSELMALDVAGVIKKPFDPLRLLDQIADLLAGRESHPL